jgi:hypothetical protein
MDTPQAPAKIIFPPFAHLRDRIIEADDAHHGMAGMDGILSSRGKATAKFTP